MRIHNTACNCEYLIFLGFETVERQESQQEDQCCSEEPIHEIYDFCFSNLSFELHFIETAFLNERVHSHCFVDVRATGLTATCHSFWFIFFLTVIQII